MCIRDSLKAVVSQRLVTGADGRRLPAVEVLINTPMIRDLLRRGQVHEIKQAMEETLEEGMESFDQCLFRLTKEGKISMEAVSYTHLDVYKRQSVVGGGVFAGLCVGNVSTITRGATRRHARGRDGCCGTRGICAKLAGMGSVSEQDGNAVTVSARCALGTTVGPPATGAAPLSSAASSDATQASRGSGGKSSNSHGEGHRWTSAIS